MNDKVNMRIAASLPINFSKWLKILSALHLSLFCMAATAQTVLQDVVQLRDRSIYRGNITERSNESIRLVIAGGNMMVIPLSTVDSAYTDTPQRYKDYAFVPSESGYFNVTSLGVPMGTRAEDYYYYDRSDVIAGFAAHSVHGYRFRMHYLAGGGVGLEIEQDPMLQLYADARYEILKLQYTPFIFADAGYGFNLRPDESTTFQNTTYSGGVIWGLGAGMRFNFSQAGALIFDTQYKVSSRSSEYSYSDSSSFLEEYTMRRIVFRLGLAF